MPDTPSFKIIPAMEEDTGKTIRESIPAGKMINPSRGIITRLEKTVTVEIL